MYSVSLKRLNLPDLYLFLTMAGIILWIVVPCYKAYHSFKKEKVKGMSLLQKWAWELRFAGIFLQAAFLPKDRWRSFLKNGDKSRSFLASRKLLPAFIVL